jgi:glucose/mannose-6-phosphate isomerase
MNHNELVGWRNKNNDLAVVLFRNTSDFNRIQARMDINSTTFAQYTDSVTEVWSKGKTNLQRSLYLIHLGDWISCYIADLKNIDAVEVDVITNLKNQLANLN